ncbi:MAG: hypothetical protein U0X74_03615 [Anaerolineales bacterium]
MKQEVLIKGNANEDLTRLVEVAIKNQLVILEQDIKASLARLNEFEKNASMSSDKFEALLESGELSEGLETLNWKMELASFRLLKQKYKSLIEAEVS